MYLHWLAFTSAQHLQAFGKNLRYWNSEIFDGHVGNY